ncbi:TIGR01777 family protein [Alteromonas aestuariivivens]|uniref:TIGR01777 family protein n=1 Tax=Alteromonas aestuariivivens TaxID=1938339 RepID=A0A3D8M418_9ALTE|nr:TIGR01777 family oxidoreductase [Alteromonas aestuariivivens]RDV24274.1 TIGR01777 family protein [Alteromonas aestuariivivens]
MNILMTGATGLIGRHFIARFASQYRFTVLSRNPERARQLLSNVNTIGSLGELNDLSDFDAVINLAGEPIADKRWTSRQKQRICESRWSVTEELATAIRASEKPPSVFISGSAIGFYGRQGPAPVTESRHQVHDEFTHQVCRKWEELALTAQSAETRVCLLRTGIVLAKDGGALEKMAVPFHFGLGGKLGSGEQVMSWIHIDDMVEAMQFLLTHPQCQGPYNLTAPHPVSNREFTKSLGSALHRPTFFTVPETVLKLALGETSELLLSGQSVLPDRLQKAGFVFRYERLPSALNAIFS